ncbi:MAG: 30S ribosomal protein S17 [Parcubacteria group bacterium]|nr:30S ribosomal protein S17 [Parcubacteria group bacterium]
MAHRTFEGIVVSDAMQKTRVIEIIRFKKHPRYHKLLKVSERLKAHDEKNEFKKGDRVVIEETRPLSRQKRWNIVKLIARKEITENLESSS